MFTKISLLLGLACSTLLAAEKPNIVFLFCDDFGYGDIQALNPERSKILTPELNKLAAEGMIFTDAHTSSSVCTPSRYGLMTGRYNWRTKLQSGVVQGHAPNLIAADRPTIATVLQSQGYHTGIIGKWHLNFRYLDPETGKDVVKKGKKSVPVGTKIPDGPTTRGFNYYHGFHHAGSMEGVIENDTVIAHDPTINMLPRITQKSVAYINERAKNKQQPFFLYVPYGSPHTPIVPTPEWQGKSGINPYADFVMQNDHSVGQILKAIDDNGIADNTLVIFSSDNGCSKAAKIDDLQAKGHYPSAHLRGSKADLWDGGHRVPFLVKWPKIIKPGTTCDQLICLTDFFATVCAIENVPLPANSAEDSVSFLPALTAQPIPTTRQGVIHHSISGHFSYRSGDWKLLLAKGSGGWTAPQEIELKDKSNIPKGQLYNLTKDPGETTNLYEANPEIVADLLTKLEKDVTNGRSTEGPAAKNDIETIILWKEAEKSGRAKKKKGKKKK